MKITFANAAYLPERHTGGNAHIYQFIHQAHNLGHEVWTYAPDQHPYATRLSERHIERWRQIRACSTYYLRVEFEASSYMKWSLPPRRNWLSKSARVAWEFNTRPHSDADTMRTLQKYGRGVNIGICISQNLAEYVKDEIGISNVKVITNGSDPDHFRPDIEPLDRVVRRPETLNIVWMGTADISLSDWHDFDLLRDVAKILWNSNQKGRFRFYIIGPERGLIRTMPPNVLYQGSEEYQRLPEWLASMDVGLVIYKNNDYTRSVSPLKLFDFMASQLAVVGTEQPQVKDVFAELEQEELLVAGSDPDSLIDILNILWNDRQKLALYGQRGRQLIMEKYNWRNITRTTFKELSGL